MSTSRVPQSIDNLVAACQASPLLGGPVVGGQQTGPVNVIDGPAVTGDPGPLALWIGVSDISADVTDAATAVQSWAGLGRMARNEELVIFCVAQAKSGSDDVRALRVAVQGIVAAVEDVVRADATLGGAVTVPGNAGVVNEQWQQGPGLSGGLGMAVRVMFEVGARARI